MRKFVHNKFEIDISDLKVAMNEENYWFSDKFFTKYSLPFEYPLDEDINGASGFIRYYNSSQKESVFPGYYYEYGKHYKAVLEIEQITDVISMSIRYGFDEFPSFDLNLRDLDLDKFEVENIYDHAASIVNQTWPSINYNFPQIHIDKIDNEEENWFYFEKIINNYKDGAFIENYQDLETEIVYNKNIMQPLAYVLYIFKKGFEKAGYSFEGDILEHPSFKKMLVYADVEYYTTIDQETIIILQMSEDRVETGTAVAQGTFPGTFSWSIPINNPIYTFVKYSAQFNIEHPGRYRLVGKIRVMHLPYGKKANITIKYRDQIIGFVEQINTDILGGNSSPMLLPYNINFTFETLSDLNPHFVTIESLQGPTVDKVIFDLEINPIRLHDSSGEAIPTILNTNQINLAKAVPDMNFGEFFTRYKNWFNLNIDIIENRVIVNFVQDQISNKPIINLSDFEVKHPVRKVNKGISFWLKFQDFENPKKEYKYSYLPIFQNASGVQTTGFIKDEKTNEITINALPLPLFSRNGVQTAHAFLSDDSRLYIVLYDGLNASGLNLCQSPDSILLPRVHQDHYQDWFAQRISSEAYSWSFISPYEKIYQIDIKGKIFAYSSNHLIKTLTKEEISKNNFRIDIETESL